MSTSQGQFSLLEYMNCRQQSVRPKLQAKSQRRTSLLTCDFDVSDGVNGRGTGFMGDEAQLAKVSALSHAGNFLFIASVRSEAAPHGAVLQEVHACGRKKSKQQNKEKMNAWP